MKNNKLQTTTLLQQKRGLNKSEAATYLGIGKTLFDRIGPKPIKLGRRNIYDLVDLDNWFNEYKRRGRASQEVKIWPEAKDSTDAKALRIGGSTLSCQTVSEYKKALDL